MGPPAADDRRTPAQRRHDGLAICSGSGWTPGELPQVGGQRPHLTLTADLATLAKLPGRGRPISIGGSRAGGDAAPDRVRRVGDVRAGLAGRRPAERGPDQADVHAAQRKALALRDKGCVPVRASASVDRVAPPPTLGRTGARRVSQMGHFCAIAVTIACTRRLPAGQAADRAPGRLSEILGRPEMTPRRCSGHPVGTDDALQGASRAVPQSTWSCKSVRNGSRAFTSPGALQLAASTTSRPLHERHSRRATPLSR